MGNLVQGIVVIGVLVGGVFLFSKLDLSQFKLGATTAPVPPPAVVPPITSGMCPEGQTGDPDTAGCFPGTCEERDGEACTCRSCCNGNGCAGTINGDKPMLSNRQCICSCSEPCGDDDDDNDDDDDDNGGDFKGKSTGPGTRSQDPLTKKLNQCAGLTGQTYLGCVNSRYARSNYTDQVYTPINEVQAFHVNGGFKLNLV